MCIVPISWRCRLRLRDIEHFAPHHPVPDEALGDTKVKKRIPACKEFPGYLVTVLEPDRTGSCLSPGPPSPLAVPLEMAPGPASVPLTLTPGHPVRTSSPKATRPEKT